MTAGTLWINGTDSTPNGEWDLSFERRTDGVGTMTITIQDRTNDPTLEYGRQRDLVQYTIGTALKFEGEIVGSTLDLPAKMPWRRWTIKCTDWNTLFDTRLIGCPDGYQWDMSVSPPIAVDPFAGNSGTDATTIVAWFDQYVRTPDGRAFDTVTYVNSYIPNNILNDPYTGQPRIIPVNSTLRSALDQMRGLAAFPIYYWISAPVIRGSVPFVHWTVFPELP